MLLGHLNQSLLSFVLGPTRGKPSRILGAIRVSDHNLLLTSNDALIGRDAEKPVHGSSCTVQILESFKEWGDSQWLSYSSIELKKKDRHNITRGRALGNYICSQTFLVLLFNHLKGLESIDRRRSENIGSIVPFSRTKQGALRGQLLLQPAQSGVFIPLRIAAKSKMSGDAVQRLLVAVALLANIKRNERESECRHIAENVRKYTIGGDCIARPTERSMDQHQIIHKLLLVEINIVSADAITSAIERSARFQPVELILGPNGCILKSVNHWLQKNTVWLTNVSNFFSELVRAIGKGQLRLDRFEIGRKQPCRLGAIRQTNLSRNIWGHIWITITIASHPGCKLDRRSIQGQTVLRAKLGLHRDIQLAKEGGDRIPKDGLNNERAALGLHLRRWLATAHLITLPDGRNFAVETVIE
mmetsp:Transcript_11272/g.26512  ORF Transcript_11272/g.26512 Transcript_11272/m.26512 type:complete len:415 (-) Transcript_11272:938-2182(-)